MIDHFDILAPVYDRVFKINHNSRLKDLVDCGPNEHILDVGGGTGRGTAILRNAERRIILDSSMKMLEQAKRQKNLFWICSASEQLPFDDQSFDKLIMVDALHHVLDQQRTMNELWRVTRRGGRIVIEEPDYRKPAVKLLAGLEKILQMRSHFLSPEQIAEGFKHSSASIQIHSDGIISWIVIDKPVLADG